MATAHSDRALGLRRLPEGDCLFRFRPIARLCRLLCVLLLLLYSYQFSLHRQKPLVTRGGNGDTRRAEREADTRPGATNGGPMTE